MVGMEHEDILRGDGCGRLRRLNRGEIEDGEEDGKEARMRTRMTLWI
jgi:hypothetical protein